MISTCSIHPFPARMAPEIALQAIKCLPQGSLVLDPMAGSGTVLRTAIDSGHPARGFDVDPLAVLMSKVWLTPIDTKIFKEAARETITKASKLDSNAISMPWIDEDTESSQFINFWYDKPQIKDLRRISWLLNSQNDAIGNALKVSLSRLIIQKKKGASLAGDVSHSRPHRIRSTNDFNVFEEFIKSSDRLARLLGHEKSIPGAIVEQGDARNMQLIKNNSIDAIVTSPPYLNAIDYIRGHRMSLIWFGYRVSELRKIRSESVGASRAPDPQMELKIAHKLVELCYGIDELPSSKRAMILRYAYDVDAFLREAGRVLRPGGTAVYVIGNSCMNDVFIDNTSIVIRAAHQYGLRFVDRYERELLSTRRYMPPPDKSNSSPINQRMGTECIVTFRKSKETFQRMN